jgi:hypothetical protein
MYELVSHNLGLCNMRDPLAVKKEIIYKTSTTLSCNYLINWSVGNDTHMSSSDNQK